MKQTLTVFMVVVISAQLANAQKKMHSAIEILSILEKSPIQYQIEVDTTIERVGFPRPVRQSIVYYENGNPNAVRSDGFTILEKNPTLKDHYIKAEEAYKSRNYADARVHYKAVIQTQPHFGRFYAYIGETYLEEGDTLNARIWVDSALRIYPRDYIANSLRGRVHDLHGEDKQAVESHIKSLIFFRNGFSYKLYLENLLNKSNQTFDPWEFDPKFSINVIDSTTTKVSYNAITAEWMTFCSCSAIWQSEPKYVLEQGIDTADFKAKTIAQAKECLFATASSWFDNNLNPRFDIKPARALSKAMQNKAYQDYLYFEVILPQIPLLIHYMNQESVDSFVSYVKNYHVVPKQ